MPERKILVFATHNANKAREVQEMLGDAYDVRSLTDIGCHDEIPEDADTLEGNARIKARYVVDHFGLDCFADDTGLEVEALGGAPGVRTARYAGETADAQANMTKLLEEMKNAPNRNARFRTVFCVIQGDEERLIEGVCEGEIATEQSGASGFGYDPVFNPKGYAVTFAEMTSEAKNAISHRGKAVAGMVNALLER
jgi:XTP/dITP diphosphohydrolase